MHKSQLIHVRRRWNWHWVYCFANYQLKSHSVSPFNRHRFKFTNTVTRLISNLIRKLSCSKYEKDICDITYFYKCNLLMASSTTDGMSFNARIKYIDSSARLKPLTLPCSSNLWQTLSMKYCKYIIKSIKSPKCHHITHIMEFDLLFAILDKISKAKMRYPKKSYCGIIFHYVFSD